MNDQEHLIISPRRTIENRAFGHFQSQFNQQIHDQDEQQEDNMAPGHFLFSFVNKYMIKKSNL